MTVRRHIFTAFALVALLGGASGCTERNNLPTLVETDEPFYVQAAQLKKQGRHAEALTAFLKVIDKRGTRSAPESHLEAALIYLNNTKDPLEAYHHFRKYLELRPNTKEAEGVRGMVKIAMREFAKQIPGRPLEDQSVRLQAEGDLINLRRENEELRAEIATLRGGGATQINRLPRMITVPDEVLAPRGLPTPVTVVDVPASEIQVRTAPVLDPRPAPANPAANPPANPAKATTKRPPVTGGLTHTVKAKETLFAIAKQYGVTVQEISAANGIRNPSAVPIGTVLKIPANGR